jgi:CheY-like chemotaxis protein
LTSTTIDGVKAGGPGLVVLSEMFRPREIAEAAAASLSARAVAKGLAAHSVIDDLPAAAIGDPVRLRAALENLIDNAVKFTERGSVTLSVAAKPAGGGRARLIFRIADTGIGLSPTELKRLFLGLVFVKRIAKAMGGNLTVESKPGRGSSFRLDVLVTPAESTAPLQPRVAAAAGGPARSLRILCAEDNPYARAVLNTILTELGHRVDFVGTGEAAVEAAAKCNYDAVLMDVILRGLDGIAAARRIRSLPGSSARVPIIGVSGRSESGEEARARAAGMDAYLVKPVSPSALAQVLAPLHVLAKAK